METNRNFKFENSPSKKGQCPKCKKIGCFRFYELLPRDYGICDHKNNCNYHNNPNKETIENKINLYKKMENNDYQIETQPEKKVIYPTIDQLKCLENLNSIFHQFCINFLKIPMEHLKKWGSGTDKFGNTTFVLQTKSGVHLNIKHMKYTLENNGENCRRDKKINFYLKTDNPQKEKFKTCLYGEHLLENEKIICLVESEKTAIICSHFYPQFNWLATCGSNGLTVEKVHALQGNQIYYLGDNDLAGSENSTLKKFDIYNLDYKKIRFKEAKTGEDLADLIIRGINPIIDKSCILNNDIENLEISNSESSNSENISSFERVENYIDNRYELRNNIISNKIEIRLRTDTSVNFKELNENNIYRELQKNHIGFSINKLKSMFGSDFVKEFNPFESYFKNLPKYDPKNDIDYIQKLTTYIPVKDIVRFEIQFKKMLVRCIAGCLNLTINKQAFILIHDQQHGGKTHFLRWLCPKLLKNYIAENINTDKDSLIAMCTNFLINMDELATLNKAEINALKSIMSKDIFKGRLPYGAREINLPRRANIIGSTNNNEFLNDDTGSVRWLCFELMDKFNFNYETDIEIDLIWSQAWFLLNNGFKYELTQKEIEENEMANANHRITTIEQELIQNTIRPSSKNNIGALFKTSTDIKILLSEKFPTEKAINIYNIGKALRILGFNRITMRNDTNGIPAKGYFISMII